MHQHTQDYYNTNAEEYSKRTLAISMSDEIDRFVPYLKHGVSILDIGCGSGRDLQAFADKGFDAAGVDGSKEMCQIARLFTGRRVYNYKFEDFTPPRQFDGLWAGGSLVHTLDTDLPALLTKVWSWLKPGGVMYASFKDSNAAGVAADGRFFNGFSLDELKQLFSTLEGVEIVEVWSAASKVKEKMWHNIILRKKIS